MTYREHEPVYRDVWDWDIVLVHGDVKIVGRILGHVDGCVYQEYGAKCQCQDGPILSSPVLDCFGKRIVDSPYSGKPVTGEARPLLCVGEGTEITVMSGKTYRLRGPRKEDSAGYSAGSIWRVYALADAESEPTRWQKFLSWIGAAA